MTKLRNITFIGFATICLFGLQFNAAAVGTTSCSCTLEEQEPMWGFYDCGDEGTCSASKWECADGYCGAGNVDTGETYCGNGQLLVTCVDPIETD